MDFLNNKIPVTILTGYLGSGKTTFINYLLKKDHGYKFAIIENEFGEVGIDDGLVLQTEEEIVETMNGCICCTVRKDLIKTIKRLVNDKGDKFNHIIIETTGLADPAPVAQTFFINEEIREICRLDSIVTFVDAKFTIQHIDEEKPDHVENEAREQVAFADVIVINKTDLVTEDEISNIKNRIKEININASIIESKFSQVPIEKIINIKSFDLKNILEMDQDFLKSDEDHHHDNSITSFGVNIEGSFNVEKLNEWLGRLMSEKGNDIYRSKGILSVHGSDDKFVFQSVHMIMNLNSSSNLGMNHKPWKKDEKRINKLCFIGKNLNKEETVNQLKDCLVNENIPDPGPKPTQKLRFNEGDIVVCKEAGWATGIVRQTWFREEMWETGKYIPYQVILLDGEKILVNEDSNGFIRSVTDISGMERYENN